MFVSKPFHPHLSVEDQKFLKEMKKLENKVRDELWLLSDKLLDFDSPPTKRLKFNSWISVVAQEEKDKASGTYIQDIEQKEKASGTEFQDGELKEDVFGSEIQDGEEKEAASGTEIRDGEQNDEAYVSEIQVGDEEAYGTEIQDGEEACGTKIQYGEEASGSEIQDGEEKEASGSEILDGEEACGPEIQDGEEACGTEIQDGVGISSPKDLNDLPRIEKSGKKQEAQSALEFDKECHNANVDQISSGTKQEYIVGILSPKSKTQNSREFDDESSANHGHNNTYPLSTNMKLINFEIVQRDQRARHRVIKALKQFKHEYEVELREGNNTRPHMEAAKHVKAKRMNVSAKKPFGHVPGIEIGDEFSFRAELAVVGLNCQLISGIDFVTLGHKKYATSVVNSGVYENERRENGVLVYSGQGGHPYFVVNSGDQKLEKGNLALVNSMKMGYPVRVLQRRKCDIKSKTLGMKSKCYYMYVYDGLYKVNKFWHERDNKSCNLVFKFELKRLPGQPWSHDANHDKRCTTPI